jgi:uncharacterized protein (DUF924 family)
MKEDSRLQQDILDFWFGHIEETITPSPKRARIWFSEDEDIDNEIRARFGKMLTQASKGVFDHWGKTARGQLALILILDQFSRHVYRNSPEAYALDSKALMICMQGATAEQEHTLSLIERVFYYFPLLHAEDNYLQEQSAHAYYLLSQYALEETQSIYDSFLQFAYFHQDIIKQFGRFPGRNVILGRESTDEELAFLKESIFNSKN